MHHRLTDRLSVVGHRARAGLLRTALSRVHGEMIQWSTRVKCLNDDICIVCLMDRAVVVLLCGGLSDSVVRVPVQRRDMEKKAHYRLPYLFRFFFLNAPFFMCSTISACALSSLFFS